MTKQKAQQRPETLIPFDPVATLNECQQLLDKVDSSTLVNLWVGIRKWRCVVRYATVSPDELRKMLSSVSQPNLTIDLFHPDLKARLVESEDGRMIYDFTPEIKATERYVCVCFGSETDFENDCVAWELEGGVCLHPWSDLRPILFAQTVTGFLEQLQFNDWSDFVEIRKHHWRLAYQYAERLGVRLNWGNVQYLDADAFAMDTLNSLWKDLQHIVRDFKLTRSITPRWLTSRNATPPALNRKLFFNYHDDFNLICDVTSGFVTRDTRIIETGIPLLLPRYTKNPSPDKLLHKLHRATLPASCVFSAHQLEFERETKPKDEDFYKLIRGKCKQCGFVFSSRFIEPHDLPYVFRKCGGEQSRIDHFPGRLDHVERQIVQRLQACEVGEFVPVRQIAEAASCSEQTVWRRLKTLRDKMPDFCNRLEPRKGHGGGLGLKETDRPKLC